MKIIKFAGTMLLCGGLLMSSGCNTYKNMSKTGQGALIGGGGGAALGAALGGIFGGGKGAGIGTAVGAAVGAGAGALIGNHMQKQAAELQKELADKAKVEEVTDDNGLKAIKVTFNSAILFPTNGTTLSRQAQTELSEFASSLINNPYTNVQIFGFTDDTGSMAVNERVASGRAASVLSYLANSGVSPTRLSAEGIPMADYVASNDTAAGRAQNRRVEIYITASKQMIEKAESGALG